MTAAVTIGGRQSARSGSTTWLTPRWILDALTRQVGFDLDPCAAPDPTLWPTAVRHITEPRDGLTELWAGRVWLNPPYGAHVSPPWINRMAEHGIGTALLFNRTDTRWFQRGVLHHPNTTARFLLAGRVKFHRPGTFDAPDNGGAPSVLVAYGDRDAQILATCGLPGAFVPMNGWTPRPPVTDPVTPAHARTGITDQDAARTAELFAAVTHQ